MSGWNQHMAISKRMQALDKKQGEPRVFWKNVEQRADGKWIWTGAKNTNHNTVDCEKYEYGNFALYADYRAKDKAIKSEMAHHVILFLTYGREIDTTTHEVTPLNDDHLDINPGNLAVRNKQTRIVVPSAQFFAAMNDNSEMRAAA